MVPLAKVHIISEMSTCRGKTAHLHIIYIGGRISLWRKNRVLKPTYSAASPPSAARKELKSSALKFFTYT